MIANTGKEFIKKVLDAQEMALNSSEGQNVINKLREASLHQNPNMTESEWEKIKKEFLAFTFMRVIVDNKDLMYEMGMHVYKEVKP